MTRERLVIVDGIRTPFAKMGTEFAALPADELGRMAVDALLTRTGIDPAIVDEVIIGCVGQPIEAANVSRVIALRAGIPRHVPAITVSRNCASGMEAITQADEKLATGRGSVFIVGGAESMSQYPLAYKYSTAVKFAALNKAKKLHQKLKAMGAFRPSDFSPRIGLLLGLTDPTCGLGMGQTAEIITRENGITREMQDAFAVESHRRALDGRERLKEEICAAYVPPGFKRVLEEDNGPRGDQSLEVLAKLRPVFDRKTGTVTAGNSSQVTDGAAALLVMGEKRAEELGLKPLGALIGYAYAGCDPERMGLGPLHAIAQAERKYKLGVKDAQLIEINEAFAGQVLAVQKLAESKEYAEKHLDRSKAIGAISPDILNVNGGAVALGHPVGATGSRLVLTALKELKRRNQKRALTTLCIGGGQGAALWVEAL
jgi:acetyl-CoA acetyltransferase family protein